jgi:hypothetical protein
MAARAVNLEALNRERPIMKKESSANKQVMVLGVSFALLAAMSAAGVAISAHRDESAGPARAATLMVVADGGAQQLPRAVATEGAWDWDRVEETESDGGYTYWLKHQGASIQP